MKITLFNTFFFLFFCTSFSYSQKTENRALTGSIADFVTLMPIEGQTNIYISRPEGIDINSTVLYYKPQSPNSKFDLDFHIEVPEQGMYIIRCENDNYHTLYDTINVKFYKREKIIKLGRLFMKRKLRSKLEDTQQLQEVVVSSTKLKFYFNNDTLVYNAAAFTTQKGFVLNDILKKMPGLEIKEDGDIYANGEQISELLLNGKDFFDKDRKTILENLPAFMLKNVKIYNRTKDSLSLIKRERDKSGLVMDVQLKKQYDQILLGNMDFGYGIDGHYYGKLFGLKFHPLYRFSGYAITNDVNKDEYVGGNGDTQNTDNGIGEKKITKVGLNYNVDQSQGRYALQGSLDFIYKDIFNDVLNNNQNFYTSGDVFSRSSSLSNQYSVLFSTVHSFYLLGNTKYDFTLKPKLSYNHTNTNQFNVAASFNADVINSLGNSWKDSLMSKELCQMLKLYGINRQVVQLESNTDNIGIQLDAEKSINIPHTDDKLTINSSGLFSENSIKKFTQRDLKYMNSTNPIWNNQYVDQCIQQKKWMFSAKYDYSLSKWGCLSLKYEHESSRYKNNNSLFALHLLDGWGEGSQHGLGVLPSEKEMLQVLDGNNSYSYLQKENTNNFVLEYSLDKNIETKKTKLSIQIPFTYKRRSLDYTSHVTDTVARISVFYPELNMEFVNQNLKEKNSYYYKISYRLTQDVPTLYNMINIKNNSDPLYVIHGNSNLKNAQTHVCEAYLYVAPNNFNHHNFDIRYSEYRNRIGSAIIYDKTNGITAATFKNINGNRDFYTSFEDYFGFGKERSASIKNEVSFLFNNSADYAHAEGEELSEKSIVRNLIFSEQFTFEKKFCNTKCLVGGSLYLNYNHSTSSIKGFEEINSYEYGGKLNTSYELPWNIKLTSDLNCVIRSGYNYSSMNDEEFIWNTNLSKTFNRITIKLDANDILNQRKNVYRYVNAQGRTEIYYNTVKRCCMIHFVWRLNKSWK